jgi:hypothetical protein
MKASGPK